jgi:glycosyltransferase involved in cell wall biosynthesis
MKYMYGTFGSVGYSLTVLIPEEYKHLQNLISDDLTMLESRIILITGKSTHGALFVSILGHLLSGRYDLIHSQGTTCGVLAAAINLLFGRPHIVTFHETFDQHTLGPSFTRIKSWIIGLLLSRVDALNTLTLDAKENLLSTFPRLHGISDKIHVIQNGIDVEYFEKTPDPSQQLLAPHEFDGEDAFSIAFLGRYMPEKGFPVLVDAIRHLKDRHLPSRTPRVLCFGWGGFIREYQAYITKNGLDEYFHFIQFQEDVRCVLRQVHLVAIPSLREACPLVPMEALVSGTPIVSSDCIGLREITSNTPAITFKVGSHEDLAHKILEIMANYQSIRAHFTAFIPTAKERYDAKRSFLKLEDLITRLTKSK